MAGTDPRRAAAERSILGFLANNYEPPGKTVGDIASGIALSNARLPRLQNLGVGKMESSRSQAKAEKAASTSTKRRGFSTRHAKRYLFEFLDKKWVQRTPVGNKSYYLATVEGYLQYHRDLEGRDTSSLQVVPRELMPPLMSKKVWRLTDDQARYLLEYQNARGSLLVLLPTGAGKTLIATLAAYRHHLTNPATVRRVLYMSPYKAINGQSLAEFRNILGPMGLKAVRQDGDHHAPEWELSKADIVVSTFESAQIALHRRDPWLEHVGLVILDEVTSLDSTRDEAEGRKAKVMSKPPRGANLDLLVTSLLDFYRRLGRETRFVGLGIPNSSQSELQRWLGSGTAILHPSQITQRYEEKIAVFENRPKGGTEWHIERRDGSTCEGPWASAYPGAAGQILEVVVHYLRKSLRGQGGVVRPLLAFVHGRKSTSELAARLRDLVAADPTLSKTMSSGRQENRTRVVSSAVIPTVTVTQLEYTVDYGIGFHHAGLFHAQRRLVEEMMNDGSLTVLFATTTLTHGVDFPVGAVIVDGRLLNFLQYSRLEYLQLRGRVNHKDPFDNSAAMGDVVVISGDSVANGSRESLRKLLMGSDPPLESRSLASGNLGMLVFKTVQYLSSRPNGAETSEFMGFISGSYEYGCLAWGNGNIEAVDATVRKTAASLVGRCVKHGLVTLDGGKLGLGTLGKVANEVGLSFYDALLVSQGLRRLLTIPKDQTDRALLALVVSLVDSADEVQEVLPRVFVHADVPRGFRRGPEAANIGREVLRSNTVRAIMDRWMNEEPVSKVVLTTPRFQVYEAGLLASARALARVLGEISRAAELLSGLVADSNHTAELRRIASRARMLSTRARYGVKEDIAASPLGFLASRVDIDDLVNSQGYPEFILRIVLRLMMKKGLSDTATLSQCGSRKPVTVADLKMCDADRETALHLARHHRKKLDGLAARVVKQAQLSEQRAVQTPSHS